MKEVLLGVALAGLAWLGYREYMRSKTKGKCGCGGKCPGATATTTAVPSSSPTSVALSPAQASAASIALANNPVMNANGETWNRKATNSRVL